MKEFLIAAVLVAVVLIPILRPRGLLVVGCYLVLLLFVPYWVGFSIAGQFVPLALMLAAFGLILSHPGSLHIRGADWLMIAMVSLALVGVLDGRVLFGHALTLAGSMAVPYFFGRGIAGQVDRSRMIRVFGIVGLVLAVWSIGDFAFDWHPFMNLTFGSPTGIRWSPIQYRGGFARSEGAMGHSIVFAAAIAMLTTFVLFLKLNRAVRALLLAICLAGVAVTFSRAGLVAYALALVLAGVFGRNSRVALGERSAYLVATIGAGLLLAPMWLEFVDAGTGDLSASTGYREGYLSLLPGIRMFGLSGLYTEYGDGLWGWASSDYSGNVVGTVDNSVLLICLQFGWIVGVLFLALLIFLVWELIKGTDDPSLIASVSQISVLATVAMITQLPYLLWFVVGMAVTNLSDDRRKSTEALAKGFGGVLDEVDRSRGKMG
ncbi:hypothetical protein FEZ32_02880 [Acidipropionibacterium jensenii]|uniref:hypothetical protein n=1 Tax=Acidipropionibacterium jensenii TaxID=1749 RepID=UPI00110A1527|nr:hypothetical protein [Acidipropionibacterium jensenii]QCV87449.1 hypothetical protein FEZ32_02880 [Acidipropionibacterium jensenii]